MKKLSTLLILSLSISATGQGIDGYLVKHSGDTLIGKVILLKSLKETPRSFQFEIGSQVTEYNVSEVKVLDMALRTTLL